MEVKYIDNVTELEASRDEILSAGVLGIDCETTGFDELKEEMTLLQLAPTPDKAFVFNTRELNNPEDFTFVKNILASNRKVLFQNGKFDLRFLTHFFGEPLAVEGMYDTMINSKILSRGDKRIRHSLDEIALAELGVHLDKSLQKSDFGATELSESQLEYAAKDACILHDIRDSQKARLTTWGLERVARLECDAVAAIADAEYYGIYLDAEEWAQRCNSQQGLHDELSQQIKTMLAPTTPIIDLWGEPVINIDSTQQLAAALRGLGVPVKDSTDEAALTFVRHKHPIVDLLLEYKKLATALKRTGLDYLDFISPVDNRIHASFQQIEAPSGRMSCRKPALQTIPREKEYRVVFKAQDQQRGHIITADYSQIELRIMAKQSGDPVLVQAYMNGDDLHNVTSIRVLGEPPDNINPDRRTIAKNINFGTAYGVSPEGFAVTAGVSVAFAEKVLREYWQVYAVLGAYLRGQASLAADQGRAYTMSGRSAVIHVNREDQKAYAAARRLGRNFGVQGTGADILKRALYLLRNQIIMRNLDAKVVNIVHDEIVVETNDDPTMVAVVVKDAMMQAGNEYLDPIPCEVGVKIGKTWQK